MTKKQANKKQTLKVKQKIERRTTRSTQITVEAKALVKKTNTGTKIKQTQKKILAKSKPKQKLPIRKVATGQINKRVLQNKQNPKVKTKKAAKTKVIKKPKAPKRKQLVVVNEAKQKRLEEKIMKQAQRDALKQQKMAAKLNKAKNFAIEPRPDLPEIQVNPILTPPENIQGLNDAKKGKKIEAKPNRLYDLADCCIFCNNREIIQCVRYGDIEGFKKLLYQVDRISNPFQSYSIDCQTNIFKEAVESRNEEILGIFLDFIKQQETNPLQRVKLPSVNLDYMGSGTPNKLQFYFPIRHVNLSRGGKEGNNAFTHDKKLRKYVQIDFNDILTMNLSRLRGGNFELVKFIIEKASNFYGLGMNALHKAALLQGDNAINVKGILKSRLQKKLQDQLQITPMHIAAVNPDPTIFKAFYKFHPSSNISDLEQRDVAHYAAANQCSDTLEFLIQKRCDVNNSDIDGNTPLIIASTLGRLDNVKVLIQEQQRLISTLDQEADDYIQSAAFNNFANHQGKGKNTPLHFASSKGHLEIVKVLIEEGNSQVDQKNTKCQTSLCLAAQQGHLKVVEYLVSKGANLHGLDKQGKSPLIHAIINGHLHIVSFLLRQGVSPNYKDASENSILHYACAYGWINIVRYLVDAGADPNSTNEWKMYPVLVAMLKGHFGIVDYMINLKNLDASFQDDTGKTLISQLCININEETANNLKFLLQKGKIDPTLVDSQGFSPLHHLAVNNLSSITTELIKNKAPQTKQKARYIIKNGKKIKKSSHNRYRGHIYGQLVYPGYFPEEKDRKEYQIKLAELQEVMIQCAELLAKAGVSVSQQAQLGNITPTYQAIANGNLQLAQWLLSKDPNAIQGITERQQLNILHIAALDPFSSDINILNFLLKGNKNELIKMSLDYNGEGLQPYHNYFVSARDFIKRMTAYMQNEEQKKYIRTHIISNIQKVLTEVTQIYANELNYDITSYTGVVSERMDKLALLLKNKVIDQDEFDRIKFMRFYELQLNPKSEDIQMKDAHQVQKEKDFTKNDLLDKVKDKEEAIGLYQFKEKNYTMNFNHQLMYERSHRYTKIVEDTQEWELNPIDFYMDFRTMDTVLNLLLDTIGSLNDKEDHKPFLEIQKTVLKTAKKQEKKNSNVPMQYRGFNKPNHCNQSVMAKAIIKSQLEFIKVLIEADCLDYNLQSPNKKLSILHHLSAVQDKEIIEQALKTKRKLFVNQKDAHGNTPLHYAAFYRNQNYIKLLLDHLLAEPNSQNNYGYTPLHMSLFAFDESKDHTPTVEKVLMEFGADLNIEDHNKRTPLFLLFFKLKPILVHGNKANDDPASITILLCKSGKIKDINHKDRFQNTALHYACARGSTISALTLINLGANLDTKNYINNTPFCEALSHNQSELCIFLIQNGCNLDIEVQETVKKPSEIKLDQKIKKMLPPAELLKQILNSKEEYQSDFDFIQKNYSFKKHTPIHYAFKHNQNGMSYLLLSKNVDMFQVLRDSLLNQKYEKFVYYLENSDNVNIKQTDEKGRNLLQIYIKNICGALTPRQEEIKNLLIKDYKMSLLIQDKKGKNILHHCNENIDKFKSIWNNLSQQNKDLLLTQKENKRQANPIVHLFLKQDIFSFNQAQNLDFFKSIPWAKLDLTYTALNKNDFKKKDVNYIFISDQYPIDEPQDPYQTNLAFQIVKQIKQSNNQSTQIKVEILQLLIKSGINFNVERQFKNQTVFQYCILINALDVIKALLGYEYIDGQFTLKDNVKPYVNLKADSDGKNYLIHAIKPFKQGTLQNIQVIDLLLKAKIDPLQKDKQGLNAFDYASSNQSVYELLLQHYPNGKPNKKQTNFMKQGLQIETLIDQKGDHIIYANQKYQYEEDAEKYLEQIKAKQLDKQMNVDQNNQQDKDRFFLEPDETGKFENCDVVKDDSTDKFFDVALTKIDVKKQFYGICNFYVIQILRDKVKQIYILWTRWGRIGDTGQYQRTPYKTLEEATKEFKKVFKQKTGNAWQDFDNSYQPIKLKYKVKRISGKIIYHRKQDNSIHYSLRQIQDQDWIVIPDTLQSVPSKLTEDQLKFIKPLVDQTVKVKSFRKEQQNNNQKVSNLFQEVFLDREALNEMKNTLEKMHELIKEKEKVQRSRNFAEFQALEEELFELSNQYYEICCPTLFAQQKASSIQWIHNVLSQFKVVQQLYDIEHVSKLLFAAAYRSKEINPYDYCFQYMNVKLESLDYKSDEYKLLAKYINNSLGDRDLNTDFLAIENIFSAKPKNVEKFSKIQQDDSDKTFNSIHNHILLFHGTNNANILNIIEQGLLIRPIQSVTANGQSLGAGIYLADKASKSLGVSLFQLTLQYCEMNDDHAYLLIVEAALGNVLNIQAYYSYEKDKLPMGYHSVRAMGSIGPDFNQNLVREDGVIIPIGKVAIYESPVFKIKEKCLSNVQEALDYQDKLLEEKKKQEKEAEEEKKELINNNQKNVKGKGKAKQNSKKEEVKGKKQQDEDVVMIDTSTKKKGEEAADAGNQQNAQAAIAKPKEQRNVVEAYLDDPSKREHRIQPNLVSYREIRNDYERQQSMNYYFTDSEYVIYNPDQIRVRYIVQINTYKKNGEKPIKTFEDSLE
ncbi:nad(+) adp-ribosyltransferase-3 [Stylonychia lemnae]|uniref:Poly [ADP-ribose] polymerase n=1 Tax=Stylonychia lemnae TaxID=5949 RepID=A0A078A4Z3_STYLE|nr:nad(+) adp-ribosyltransferase-3 [Stylonychia lemnae]|eukprot:CDW76924.1 nad(+) adp-ribosyltransferase-3 [Stylonychia lemnae]